MLNIFKTVGDRLVAIENLGEKGSWISLAAPSEIELSGVCDHAKVSPDLLRYPLDEEEISRIEFDEGQALIIIKIPVIRGNTYDTIPLGMIMTEELFITVSLEKNELLDEFASGKLKTFNTNKKTRFLLQILFRTATLYLKYLRQIDKKTDEVERRLHQSMRNEELIKLLDLQKSLVYFTTSLKSNEIVMEKLLKSRLSKEPLDPDASNSRLIKMYEEDEDLLEDVITENKQAIEMGEIYTSILSGTMDAFASVISNNLNIVMKFLTSVTIVLSIPTIIASLYGMNVPLPFQDSPHAFAGTLAVSASLAALIVMVFVKRRMF
ncbi:magnesium transporter [Clostridiales bacterium PH28_bin88]|nr:magnesium transporter [Clostridiales bacterium PH28_bin88]